MEYKGSERHYKPLVPLFVTPPICRGHWLPPFFVSLTSMQRAESSTAGMSSLHRFIKL